VRAAEILHARLSARLQFIHASRWGAVWRVVTALIAGHRLWLTALGRQLPGDVLQKHGIKAVDRLLGNRHLQRERFAIASEVVALVAGKTSTPIVLVDTVEIQRRVIVVTAALAYNGRSFPFWSTKVRHYRLNSAECRRFLSELARILPSSARPVLVTDAGFETPWILEVERRGWHFITRVRGQVQVCLRGRWVELRTVRKLATRRPKNLGMVRLRKAAPIERRLVLSKIPTPRHRQVMTRSGPARGTNYKVYRENAHQPVVAATSLTCRASVVIEIYAMRMQIEESFRDLKNHRWGWSLRHCGTRARERLELLFLIASIASLIQQLVGLAAEHLGLQRSYQANTSKRRVLSIFLLGALVLNDRRRPPLPREELRRAFYRLRQEIACLGDASS
jgi:hypothetical protein